MPGDTRVPWHPQILADQLTLSQPGWIDYAHLITTGTPRFSDLPMAKHTKDKITNHHQMVLNCSVCKSASLEY